MWSQEWMSEASNIYAIFSGSPIPFSFNYSSGIICAERSGEADLLLCINLFIAAIFVIAKDWEKCNVHQKGIH